MKTITLRQAAQLLHDQGCTISCGSFDSLESFLSYWDIHYAPLMDALRTSGIPNASFLASDLEALMK